MSETGRSDVLAGSNSETDKDVSRRTFVKISIAGMAAGLTGCMAGTMGGNVSKAEAQYRDAPNGEQRCGGCVHFIGPNSCSIVEGPISPNGWCRFFRAR
jgi:hypothetical protein